MRFVTFAIALSILASPFSGIVKALGLISLSFFSFRPWNRKKAILFSVSSIVFVLSDIGAIRNGFFEFTSPDLFGLPYWEFVAWGFWILFGYQYLPHEFPQKLDWKTVVLVLIFSQSFALIGDRTILLAVSIATIALSLAIYRNKVDVRYLIFFSIMGFLVEVIGLYFELWSYPNANIWMAGAQFVVMWAGVGLFFRNLAGPFLRERSSSTGS